MAPQNWLAASFMTAAAQAIQAAGFFAFNNYSSNLTWWTHQGDASYHSLQALFKTRYKRSQLTGGLYVVTLDRERDYGRLLAAAFRIPRALYVFWESGIGSWQFRDQPSSHLDGEL